MKSVRLWAFSIMLLFALPNFAWASKAPTIPAGNKYLLTHISESVYAHMIPDLIPPVLTSNIDSPPLATRIGDIATAAKEQDVRQWMREPQTRIIGVPARTAEDPRYRSLVVVYAF